MPYNIYQLVALAARYWFIFLILVIVFRSFIWLNRDNRSWRRKVKAVPSAGNVGEAVVIMGNENIHLGDRYPISREGILGSGKACDISLNSDLIKKHQIYYRFEEDQGLYLEIISNKAVLDDISLDNKTKTAYALHGSVLVLGNIMLKLFFFSGLGVPFASMEAQKYALNIAQCLNNNEPEPLKEIDIQENNHENNLEGTEYVTKYDLYEEDLDNYNDTDDESYEEFYSEDFEFENPDDMQSYENLGGNNK